MGNEHPCPRCGQPTIGAWTNAGTRWAICEECIEIDREYSQVAAELEAYERDCNSRLQRSREQNREQEENNP